MNTETGLHLERLRYHAAARIQATRHDPDLTDEEKRERITAIRQAHAARAQAVIAESERKSA